MGKDNISFLFFIREILLATRAPRLLAVAKDVREFIMLRPFTSLIFLLLYFLLKRLRKIRK